jgi:hypothetical protein
MIYHNKAERGKLIVVPRILVSKQPTPAENHKTWTMLCDSSCCGTYRKLEQSIVGVLSRRPQLNHKS